MTLPLSGVCVLDLTRLLPGAICTLMLADLGADIIKVEDPNGGDYARWMPPLVEGLSVYFHALNRNKRSLILDLKRSEGRAVLFRLVEQADVLVEGFRPGVMTRLGCDYTVLKGVNPRLVYCAISGWGGDGPYADRSGHDLNYVSVAGLTGLMETPSVLGGQIADTGGAYVALAGILAALFRRVHTGEGGLVDAALFEAVLPFIAQPWTEAIMTGVMGGQGALTGAAACYNIYRTQDGQAISLAALEPKFWANFCAAVNRPDLLADYLEPAHQITLKTELTMLFASKTADEWDTLLDGANCCYARVAPPQSLVRDPQVQARELLGINQDGVPWLRSPVRVDAEAVERSPAPGYGEHTAAVLRQAGYTDGDIDRLREAGVIN